MSEDKIQVKIEADASDFSGALKEAVASLAASVGEMKSSFAELGENIKSSMQESANASSQASRQIADSMKTSAVETKAAVEGLSKSVKDLHTETGNTSFLQGFGDKMKEAMQSAIALTAGVVSLQGALELLKNGISYNAQMEQAAISFDTMLSSTEKAKQMIADLQKMAAETPFEFPDLQDGAKRMLAFGFSAESVIPTLTAVGDAAAGLGMSGRDGINRIVLALGQMQAKGKVSAEEMLQMTEAGIPAWDILAKSIGKTTAEVMKMAEQGAIPADKAIQALVAGMEERFPNMMQKQSKSFNGMMSTIRDNFNMVIGDIVKPGFEELTSDVLPNVVEALDKFSQVMKKSGTTAAFKTILPEGVVDAAVSGAKAIGDGFAFIRQHASLLTGGIVGLTTAFSVYRGIMIASTIATAAQTIALSFQTGAVALAARGTAAFTLANIAATASAIAATVATEGLAAGFTALAAAMNINPIILAITLSIAALATCVYLVYDNWEEFKGWCIGFWNDIVDFIADNIGLIMLMFPRLAVAIYLIYEYWDDGVALIAELWNSFTGFLAAVVDVIKRIIDSVSEAWPKFVEGAQEGVLKFAEALAELAGEFIPDWVKSIWDQIVGLASKLAAKTAEIGNSIRNNLKISGGGDGGNDSGEGNADDTSPPPAPPAVPKFEPVSWSGVPMPSGGAKVGSSSGAGRSSGAERSEYEQAKKLYDQQLKLAEYSATEKEALYKKYLENVKKSDQEAMDYKIGLYQLDKDAFAESLNAKEIELENSKLRSEMTEMEYTTAMAELKRQNLEAEVNFRAKAAMEQANLTEQEKVAQLTAYQEKIQATEWYKKALKEVLTADKALADEQKSIASSLADFRKQLNLNELEDKERQLERLREQDQITQEQLLTAKKELEARRYELEKASMEQNLFDSAKNIDAMKAAYAKYVAARSQATKEMIAEEMVLNGLSADKVKAILEQIEKLYGQYTNKQLDLDNDLRKERIKNLEQIRDSMKDTMSEAFQGVLTKSMSFLEALKNVFSSTMKNILKQFADTISKTITDKAFKKFTENQDKDNKKGNNNNKDRGKELKNQAGIIAAEQAKEAQLTAIAAQGEAERATMKAASDQQELVMTSTTTAAETTMHTTADQTISASAQMAGQTAVQSIQASLQAMISMLPTLLIMSALSGLFGGGKTKTTESTGPGVNLGRNPDSYYKTPTLAGIPSFDVGSWQLPADTLAMVHKNEMIVPAKGGIADGVRNMLTNGGGQSGGSSPTFNINYSAAHYGRTNRDVQGEMKQNAKFLVKTLNSEYRNFNRGKVK